MLVNAFAPRGLAFVDIETTGGPPQHDAITEVGIVSVDVQGVHEWSTLVRPATRIPDNIVRLTGISNAMVARAPAFDAVAEDILTQLEGRLFIAHNARFDHGHLKAAFGRRGQSMQQRPLCTVRLSRRLYPAFRRHSLDHLIARHALEVSNRHRALGDARLLWQFWQHVNTQFGTTHVEAALRALLSRPSLPAHLDPNVIESMPDTPGVYLFYGESTGAHTLPLYIGKSTRLRTRVLSHFSSDHQSGRGLNLSRQIHHIEWRETAGELEALIEEARLIKHLQPVHNRQLRRNRELCAWRLAPDLTGTPVLELVYARDMDFGRRHDLYGLFRNRRTALAHLRELAHEHGLCPTLLGLEARRAGKPCFSFQLRRCQGACVGHESPQRHAGRLQAALSRSAVESWPFDGPVGIREGAALHVIDGWRHLGTARDATQLDAILAEGRPAFDMDIYKILIKAVKNLPTEPVEG